MSQVNKIIQKISLLSLLLIPFINLSASQLDTIPVYSGYRLQVSGIDIVKEKKQQITILCNITNTGKYALKIGNNTTDPTPLIEYDATLSLNSLIIDKQLINEAILEKDLTFAIGQTVRKLKITYTRKASDAPISENTTPKAIDNAPKTTTPPPSTVVIEVAKKDSVSSSACPDLIIEKVEIVKKKKKCAIVDVSIYNSGNAPARLFDPNDKKLNIAIRAYGSGTPKISRSSFAIGEMPIEATKTFTGPNLAAKERLKIRMEIDTSEMTKYSPIAIFYIDEYQKIYECDKKNNTNYIIIK